MNRSLWILQIVLGVYFIAVGVIHFIVPDNLPSPMSWMYEMSTGLHIASGTLEILGGLGLILPSVLRIQPRLTPLAAVGLALLMGAAAVWHVQQDDATRVPQNILIAAVLLFVAYGRWRLAPLDSPASST